MAAIVGEQLALFPSTTALTTSVKRLLGTGTCSADDPARPRAALEQQVAQALEALPHSARALSAT